MGGAVDVAGNVAGSPAPAADNTAAEWNISIMDFPTAMAESSIPVSRFVWSASTAPPGASDTDIRRSGERSEADSAPPLDVLAELFDKNDYMTGGTNLLRPVAQPSTPPATRSALHRRPPHRRRHRGGHERATRRGRAEPNAGYLTDVEADRSRQILLDVLAAG